VITAGCLVGVSLAVFGIEAHLTYLDVLRWGKGWGPNQPAPLWDTTAAYRPLHVVGGIALPLRVIGTLVIIGLTLLAQGADRVFNPRVRARHAETVVDEEEDEGEGGDSGPSTTMTAGGV
jgi:peptide/nickel transport system permease protein